MTQEFKRERRYVVLKLKDADNIPNPVRERLDDALREANQYLPDREYVVIESDWPEYEVAWKMIEARCGGAAQAQQTTEKGTACSTSNFRKKPVVIQAKQLTEETIREVYEWVHGPVTLKHRLAEDRWDDYCGIVKTDGMNIPTLEDGSDGRAKHVASIGDWIIRGIAGEFYPCKPDIFAATYEPVAQAQQTTNNPFNVTRPDEPADYGHDNSVSSAYQTPYYCSKCDTHMGDVDLPKNVPLRKDAICWKCMEQAQQPPVEGPELPWREVADCVLDALSDRAGILDLDVEAEMEEEIRQEVADTIKAGVQAWMGQQSQDAKRYEELMQAVKLAYGHLWHTNDEPMAPIPLRSPEKASYEARKVLRGMLTTEERGHAISQVADILCAAMQGGQQ